MKIFQILIVSITVLLIAACAAPERVVTPDPFSAKGTDTPSASMTIVPVPKTYANLTVGFTQIGAISEWVVANSQSVKDTARDWGVELSFLDGQCKQENQIRAIRQFIAMHVDVIGVTPMVSDGWDTVLGEAKQAGIPIILLNRPADIPEDLYASYLANDQREEGRKAGRALAEILKGNGAIVELAGTEGAFAAQGRGQGFREVLREYPGLVLLDSQIGDFTRSEGKAAMAKLLAQYGDQIQAVFAHNDDMAIGAIEAIEEAGRKPGVEIKIVSIDGTRAGLEAMAAGKLNAIVECNPEIGPRFLELALKLAKGEDVPKFVAVEESVFYPEDAERLLPSRKY